ncbi:MAG: ester cyclase, partial [Chthoniobacteraceae bacterium]
QWFRRVWNESDPSAIDELGAPDFLSHGLIETIRGPVEWREKFYEPTRAALSDVRIQILEEVVSGGRIFARLVATQTPKATGQTVSMHGSCLMRIENGRIAEAWDTWDFLGLLEGMRLMPNGSFGRAIAGTLQQHPMA